MTKKQKIASFLDFSDRKKLFRYMFVISMVTALLFGFLGFNRVVGYEEGDEEASADDPIGECTDNQQCNIGHSSCGDNGNQFFDVPEGQVCTMRGSIVNHGNIWTDPVKLTIRGSGCSQNVNFSECGKTFYRLEGCQPGRVTFGADDSSYIVVNSECASIASCGNGNVDQGEECDDGNNDNNDGCSNGCLKPNKCNDVCVGSIGCKLGLECSGERCRNSSCTDESDCTCSSDPSDPSSSASASASCEGIAITTNVPTSQGYLGVLCNGNGRTYRNNISPGGGTISEGNGSNGTYAGSLEYGVSYSCMVIDAAGDGGEATANSVTMPSEIDCVPSCGNDRVDEGEACDDGNNIGNDGCEVDCTLPDSCNNVCTDALGCSNGYTCSDGNCRNDVCSEETDCTCASCGDGTTDEGEECDEGDDNNETGTCSSQCRLTTCGDGTIQTPNGNGETEQCDDGNSASGDGCSSICTTEGDGTLAIIKTPSITQVRQGDVVRYTVVATNTGEQSIDNVVFTDDVPDGLSFVSGSISVDGQSISDAEGYLDGRINVTVDTLTANQNAVIVYSLRVDTAAQNLRITNIVVGDSDDTDPAEASATITTPVVLNSADSGVGTAAAVYFSLAALMAAFSGAVYWYYQKLLFKS